jgi:PAP2 superfamily
MNHRELYAPREPNVEALGFLRRLVRELAVQDWLVLAYLIALTVIALHCPPSANQQLSAERMASLLVFMVATVIVVRGGLVKNGLVAPLLYRMALYGTVQLSYFFLAKMLPIVNPTTLDGGLYRLDLHLFGFEPAVVMDQLVTPITTEWFSFFYFGYFFLLAIHVVPLLLFSRSPRILSEFALGMLLTFCVGHLVYMLVPGYGPHQSLAGHFHHELPHGMWRDMVMAMVAEGGAQLDIFPSLHTGAPAFIVLFSLRHRDKLPFRYSWPVAAFFAFNIMVATMFLRWHYVIDVVAGLAVATLAFMTAVRVTDWELERRANAGLSENWPRFSLKRRA